MYTITFMTPQGKTLSLGDRFTQTEISSVALLFPAEETNNDTFTLETSAIGRFVEWYHTTFPDRNNIEHIVVGYLSSFSSVTMRFDPVEAETEMCWSLPMTL